MLKNGRVAARLPAQDLGRRGRSTPRSSASSLWRSARAACATSARPASSPAGAPSGDHTQMGCEVDDIDTTVRQLRARGVVFEEYDAPGLETVDGLADIDGKGNAERGASHGRARRR